LGHAYEFVAGASKCTSGSSACVALGKTACDSEGSRCWGYAVHHRGGAGVQLYGPTAASPSVCSGVKGLMANNDWTTYQKPSQV
jgi:hypothetical protein